MSGRYFSSYDGKTVMADVDVNGNSLELTIEDDKVKAIGNIPVGGGDESVWTDETFNALADDDGDDILDENDEAIGDETAETLWATRDGVGFKAKRAEADINGNSLELTVENNKVVQIGGKSINAEKASTDINGKSLELTILNNERVTQIGGLTVGADAPDLTKYYYNYSGNSLSVSLGNSHDVGKLITTSGNMNSDTIQADISTEWAGLTRRLVSINTYNSNYSFLNFGSEMRDSGRRFLLPVPVANKYAKTNADGNIIWGDLPEILPASTASDENKVLRVNNEGNPVWSQMATGTFGSITDDNDGVGILTGNRNHASLLKLGSSTTRRHIFTVISIFTDLSHTRPRIFTIVYTVSSFSDDV